MGKKVLQKAVAFTPAPSLPQLYRPLEIVDSLSGAVQLIFSGLSAGDGGVNPAFQGGVADMPAGIFRPGDHHRPVDIAEDKAFLRAGAVLCFFGGQRLAVAGGEIDSPFTAPEPFSG